MPTTIQVSDSIKRALEKRKLFARESYNEVIERIIEDDLELSEQTKRELEERRRNPKLISHEDAKRILGL